MLLFLMVLGCDCGQPPPAPAAVPHFGEWERLVRLVAVGNASQAQIVARDLMGGEVLVTTRAGKEAWSDVGAAVGAMQADEELLFVGLAKAAAGCGACHRAEAAQAPPKPADVHALQANRVAWDVVWGGASSEALETTLDGCASCHAE